MVIQRRRQKGDSSLSLCFGVWKKPWWFYFLRRKLERERESVDGVERPTSFANASGRAGGREEATRSIVARAAQPLFTWKRLKIQNNV
jgi:hypothetical protein